MKKKNILFVFAHMDDEVYSLGTMLKLKKEGHNIFIITVCGNGRAAELHTNYPRRKAWEAVNLLFDIDDPKGFGFYDLYLAHIPVEKEHEIKVIISREIKNKKINYVFTNNSGDQHQDHKKISELVRLCCREDNTTIEKLYECYVPGTCERGEGIKDFNVAIEVSEFIDEKKKYLSMYGNELKNSNTIESTIAGNLYFGRLYNCQFAEIFKLVYSRHI